jgi:hypothetical protein
MFILLGDPYDFSPVGSLLPEVILLLGDPIFMSWGCVPRYVLFPPFSLPGVIICPWGPIFMSWGMSHATGVQL